jgi:phospholipase/carboxylesterase
VSDHDLGFVHVHVFEPATRPGAPTLLLLHGTGGNEHDLIPLGRLLDPTAALLSPRGKVLERGMPRFFRRLSEGVFDEEDLKVRTHELAGFVAAAARRFDLGSAPMIAVGFSNGANIAASLLLLAPGTLAGAVLFRAMVPLVPDPVPSLAGTSVLLSNGRTDTLIPPAETERLAALLLSAGIGLTLVWQPGGHQLAQADVDGACEWLAARI